MSMKYWSDTMRSPVHHRACHGDPETNLRKGSIGLLGGNHRHGQTSLLQGQVLYPVEVAQETRLAESLSNAAPETPTSPRLVWVKNIWYRAM